MKKYSTLLLLSFLMSVSLKAQISKSNIGSKSGIASNVKANQGVKLPNIDRIKSTDLKRLKIPTISITDAQKNARAISSWKISPIRPKYSGLELVRHYGEYTLQGWRLEPRPRFEGPNFKGYNISAIQLKFRVTNGTSYLIKVKLKDASNWYEGKTILAAAMDNTFARYPIDARNNEILIPFKANGSGIKTIHIGNVINNDRLFAYTIKSVKIDKI